MSEPVERLGAGLSDRYRLGPEIGRGGMATVHQADDLVTGDRVAIKILRRELAAVLGPERFLREIDIARRLHHPAIVPLIDSGEVGGSLYFVMPLIRETLRQRLRREIQLPVDDALRIAGTVADGLQYAHDHDVVHRDIKPENILLDGERVMIADFGVARVVNAVDQETLSTTGLALGTPAYMSPEQASGTMPVDGRSDVYSLGCVLYEMLAGEPPFTGPTPQVVAARHMVESPRSLRVVRPSLDERLQGVIERALAKVPADRFQSAGEFTRALAAPGPRRPAHRRAPFVLLSGLGIAAVATVAFMRLATRHDGSLAETSSMAVFPFDAPADSGEAWTRSVRDHFADWEDITLVGADRVGRVARPDDPSRSARSLARDLGARYLVRGSVTSTPDGVRIRATMYDAVGDSVAAEAGVDASSASARDSAAATLVRRLLLGEEPSIVGASTRPVTRSVSAWRSWLEGQRAIAGWRLSEADSAFAKTLRAAPNEATAAFWIALVRLWQNEPVSSLAWAVDRAAPELASFSPRDQTIGHALADVTHGDLDAACRGLSEALPSYPRDFAVAYSTGSCLYRDDAVVRDPRSPSGWRFRASYASALAALQRAFALAPSIHQGLSEDSFRELRATLFLEAKQLRSGRSDDGHQFFASPEWIDDSLTFIPYPQERFTSLASNPQLSGVARALLRQRQLFYRIAAGWVAAYPSSSSAVEAVGLALDRLGDRTAADTIRRARSLTGDRDRQAVLAATELWMRLRRALPDDTASLGRIRRLADSILGWAPPAGHAAMAAAGVSLLVGRPDAAVRLLDRYGIPGGDVPDIAAQEGLRLLAYAASGGPRDSLDAIATRVDRAIRASVLAPADTAARLEWLGRPATLAFPGNRLRALDSLAGQGDYLIDMIDALGKGDSATVDAGFARLRAWRASVDPADLAVDAVVTEASILARSRSAKAALDWLSPVLDALPSTSPLLFLSDLGSAGTVVRAVGDRARLHAAVGDRTGAVRWARAAALLLAASEPTLRPRLDSMLELSRWHTRERSP